MRALFFFFNDTATTEIYTLSLHDALPISAWSSASVDARAARRVEIMDLRRIEAQRQRSGVRLQGSRQPGGDARAAVRCKMAVDQRIGSERLDEIDFGDQHGFSRRARLEVLRADAEQYLAPLPLPRDQVHRRRAHEPREESGGRPRGHLVIRRAHV